MSDEEKEQELEEARRDAERKRLAAEHAYQRDTLSAEEVLRKNLADLGIGGPPASGGGNGSSGGVSSSTGCGPDGPGGGRGSSVAPSLAKLKARELPTIVLNNCQVTINISGKE